MRKICTPRFLACTKSSVHFTLSTVQYRCYPARSPTVTATTSSTSAAVLFHEGLTKEELNGLEKNPNPFLAATLISKNQHNIQNALNIYHTIKRKDCLNMHVINSMIKVCQNGPELNNILNDAMQLLASTQWQVSVGYDALVCGLCHLGRVQDALYIAQQLKEKQIQYRNPATITTLLKGCHKQSYFAEAIDIFNSIERPDIIHYNSMLTIYVAANRLADAIEFFKKMERMHLPSGTVTYSILISGCANSCNLETGEMLFKHMLSRKIQPDDVVMNVLIDLYANCRQLDRAIATFKKVSTKSVGTWNRLINAFVLGNELAKAEKLLHIMIQSGLAPNNHTYITLFAGCTKALNIGLGERLYNHLKQRRISPNFELNMTILTMFAKCGKLTAALSELDAINKTGKVSLTIEDFMKALIESKDLIAAEQLIYHTERRNSTQHASASLYSLLLSACVNEDAVEVRDRIRKHMNQTNVQQSTRRK